MIDLIVPREDEIRRFAFELFDRRGGEDGWDVADWMMAERALRFFKNYERVAFYPFTSEANTYLGTKTPRVCRYCGKTTPEVSFSKDAHAIPAFLGNRSVYAFYECNNCNDAFSSSLEDHFGKMLHGVRTAAMIRGRTGVGVPSYKTRRKLTRIDVDGDQIEIKQVVSDPVTAIDQEQGSVTLSLETQPFIPLAVYKCLAKIALSLMPEPEMAHFSHTLDWVCDLDHSRGAANFIHACAYRAMTPGPFPERYGWAELFRRRHDAIRVPYMVLVIVCMNLTFQIYVPLCRKDEHLLGQQLTVPRFPAGVTGGYEFGETEFKNMNLSSPLSIAVPVEVILRSDIVEQAP